MRVVIVIVIAVGGCLGVLSMARAANSPAPTLKEFAANYEQKCHEDHVAKIARLELKDPKALTEAARLRNRSLEKAKCQCMAGKMRDVVDTTVAQAILTQDSVAAGPFYLRAYQECMVVSARETMLPLCLAEAKAGKNAAKEVATCRCIADGAANIDDVTFIEESIATFKSYEQRTKDPLAPLYKGRLAAIEAQCQAQAGPAKNP